MLYHYVFLVLILGNIGVNAQNKRIKPTPVREDFCLRLDKILKNQCNGFTYIKDSLSGEMGAAGRIGVAEDYTFDQAACELVTLPTGKTVYQAVFMTRDSRESVVASYKNLLAMVKECYSNDFIFTDKTSKIRKIYECRGVPYNIDVHSPQAEIVVYISEDWVNKIYQLVLQVE